MENKMKERNWKYKITGNWFGPMVIAITTAVSGDSHSGFTLHTMVPLLDSAA